MHDSLLSWTANVTGPTFAEHRAHVVKEERNWGGAAFYNIYETKDGQYIVLGGVEHKFCESFLNKAGRPDLIPLTREPPGPVQDPVKDYLRAFFLERTRQQALDWLADTEVCYAPLRDLYEGFFDPNTQERGMLLVDEQGNEHIGVPIKYRNEPAQAKLHVPQLGEHSAAILAELGYGKAEIEQLARDSVI
jgi:crotonobetainyl-CoA:carnitine CoA-transferase CaiB-like acyl-CoA transferase